MRSRAEIEQERQKLVILVAVVSRAPSVLADLAQIARQHELYVPDIPLYPDDVLFDEAFVQNHQGQLMQAYRCLADERSRQMFACMLGFKYSGHIRYLQQMCATVGEGSQLLQLGLQEHYLDLGAGTGASIEEFLYHTGGCYASITALEPDIEAFGELREKIRQMGLQRVRCLDMGADREAGRRWFSFRYGRGQTFSMFPLSQSGIPVEMTTVDQLYADHPLTYLRMDVEGAEAAVLEGAAQVLRTQRPRLRVALYHRNTDLFVLPLTIRRLSQTYSLYLRAVPCVPAWGVDLYAV